jgi:hypothetical protein
MLFSCKNKKIVNIETSEEDEYKLYNGFGLNENEVPYYRNINEIVYVIYGFGNDEDNNSYKYMDNNICKVHNIEMEKNDIKLISGILRLNNKKKELNKLRRDYFPNSSDPVSSYDVIFVDKEYVKLFVCYECNNERKKYINILGLGNIIE